MSKQPSIKYIGTTIGLFALTVVGAWLPWVRKLPSFCSDGKLFHTDEGVYGLHVGFNIGDQILIFVVLIAVCITLLSRTLNWSPDVALVLAGAVVLWLAGEIGHSFWLEDTYVPHVGFYITIVSGISLIILGADSLLSRHVAPRLMTTVESADD